MFTQQQVSVVIAFTVENFAKANSALATNG